MTRPSHAMHLVSRLGAVVAVVAALAVAAGCASSDTFRREGVDFAQYQRIGIGDFDVSDERAYGEQESVRQKVVQTFAARLLEKGYDVADRNRLEEVLREQGLQWSEATTREGRAEIGKVMNVDALVMGSIPRYRRTRDGDPQVVVQAKLVDVETGQVLWGGTAKSGLGSQVDPCDLPFVEKECKKDPDLRKSIRDVKDQTEEIRGQMLGHLATVAEDLCEKFPSPYSG